MFNHKQLFNKVRASADNTSFPEKFNLSNHNEYQSKAHCKIMTEKNAYILFSIAVHEKGFELSTFDGMTQDELIKYFELTLTALKQGRSIILL